MATTGPAVNDLVEVRGQRWVVSELDTEPGRRVLPAGSLPDLIQDRFDAPQRLAAFLDAVRWSAVTSADTTLLQAPFRSGVAIEDYQLEPVARAVEAPSVNLLLADDVGLGKAIRSPGRRSLTGCSN